MIDQVLTAICEIAGADEGEIAPDTELFEEGILDSFGLVELLVQLEQRYPNLRQKIFGAVQRYPLYGWNLEEMEK